MTRILRSLFVTLSLLAMQAAYCQTPLSGISAEEKALLAFVQLGHFSDRGLIANLAAEADSSNPKQIQGPVESIEVPKELLELLTIRENNLSPEPIKLPDLPWVFEDRERSPEAVLSRFRRQGLIELFQNQDSRLLDSPLNQRRELMERFEAIGEQYRIIMSALFAKGLTDVDLIIIAGHVRSLSVELDNAILKALTPSERSRIGKLVSHLLPRVIVDAKGRNQQLELGSTIASAKSDLRPKSGKQK